MPGKLYWNLESPYARVAKWALLAADVEHGERRVEWSELKEANGPVQALNPRNQVPVFVTPQGETLIDALRICALLCAHDAGEWLGSQDALLYRAAECDLGDHLKRLYELRKHWVKREEACAGEGASDAQALIAERAAGVRREILQRYNTTVDAMGGILGSVSVSRLEDDTPRMGLIAFHVFNAFIAHYEPDAVHAALAPRAELLERLERTSAFLAFAACLEKSGTDSDQTCGGAQRISPRLSPHLSAGPGAR